MKQGHVGRANSVGRVGALALLLGVGVVLTPGVALADAGSPDDTAATAGAADSPRATTPRHARTAHRDAAARNSDTAPAPSADARAARGSKIAASVRAARQGLAKAAAVAPQALAAAGPEPAAVPDAVESPTASVVSAPSASVTDGPAAILSALQTRIATTEIVPAAAAPLMTVATPRGALAATDPLAWLGGGGNPLAPIAAPLGWATLAVSRRDFERVSAAVAPAAAVSLSQLVSSPLTDALGQSGATAVLVAAAKQFVMTAVGGGDVAAALQTGIRSLENNPLFTAISLQSLLADPNLPQTAGSATASVVTALAGDPQVRAAVGDAISGYLSSALGNLPASIAPAVADAAVALLADPAAGAALGSVAGSMVTVFLSQPGVVSDLSNVAYQLQAALNGKGFGSALDAAWESLQAAPAVEAGVVAAVTEGVNTALTDPRLVAALGTAAASLVGDLSADPSTWTLVGDLLGPTYGSVVEGLLSDPAAAAQLAATAGTVLTDFLGQPGVVGALSGAAGQLASSLLAGASTSDALNSLFDSLQNDPAILAAVNSTVSVALHGLLGDSTVKEAVSAVAEQVVVNLITGSTDTSGLSPAAGQFLSAAVDSLLGDTAVQDLIGEIAPAIVGGGSVTELTTTVIQAVIDEPALQTAVGTAVGDAVGSLIGDNPVGKLVGQVVGKTVSVVLHAVVKFAPLLKGLGLKLPGAAAAQNPSGSGYLFAVTTV